MRASIAHAEAGDDYLLHMTLNNGNEMTLDFKQLFQYQPFSVLSDESKWKNMRMNEEYLFWGDSGEKVELSIEEILNYFA